jgi:hypothetical protein
MRGDGPAMQRRVQTKPPTTFYNSSVNPLLSEFCSDFLDFQFAFTSTTARVSDSSHNPNRNHITLTKHSQSPAPPK